MGDPSTSPHAHTADCVCGAFFFAMRSCKFCLNPCLARPKCLLSPASCSAPQSASHPLPFTSPSLLLIRKMVPKWTPVDKNAMVTLSYASSSAGLPPCLKCTAFSHRNFTDCCLLSPILPHSSAHLQCLCLPNPPVRLRPLWWHKSFRFWAPFDIGSKSICLGAAMSLFLMDHFVACIMILGRWSSDTFLVYIRPQVLDWTNNIITAKKYCGSRSVSNRLNVLIRIMILRTTSALPSFVSLYQQSATRIGRSLMFNYP
jgi:hypothetical protein